MQDLPRAIAGANLDLEAVLHVGAGSCSELDYYQWLNARNILLVEANPLLAERLRKKVQASSHVRVVDAAVAESGESRVPLYVLNNPRESTIMRPTRLLQRLPNLSITRELEVPALPLAQAISDLAPAPSRRNLLVLELQGAEYPVLASTPMEDLRKFSWIVVRVCTEPLHDGGADAGQVDALLARAGFQTVMPQPPHPALPFQKQLYMLQASPAVLQELSEARQLQALREADLAELQARYGALSSARAADREVLATVAGKLRAAVTRLRGTEAAPAVPPPGKHRGGDT